MRAAWMRSRPERRAAASHASAPGAALCRAIVQSLPLSLRRSPLPPCLPASKSASYAVIRHSRSLSGASAVLLHHYIAVQLYTLATVAVNMCSPPTCIDFTSAAEGDVLVAQRIYMWCDHLYYFAIACLLLCAAVSLGIAGTIKLHSCPLP